MNGIGSNITRIPIALYTATHMCALMLTPAQIDVQMADATFCKTSAVIKNYQSSEIFSRGLSESRRRALLVNRTTEIHNLNEIKFFSLVRWNYGLGTFF